MTSPPPPSSPPGSSPGSPDGGSSNGRKEHPAVGATRVLVTGGGAVALGIMGLVPPLYVLGALVVIALPTHAGRLIDLFSRKK